MFIKERFFSFTSMAYAGDTFAVATFTTQEKISELYDMELLLVSQKKDIDFADILESPANIIVHQDHRDLTLFAIVREFEQLHSFKDYVFYRARLAPKLWWLTLASQNRVFLDKTVPQILEETLKAGGLSSRDYEFRLKNDYPARELVCQYNETGYHFFRRWIEREGLYYYFERLDDATKVVITDTAIAHKELKSYPHVRYAPPSGLEEPGEPVVRSLVCSRRLAPSGVLLKDIHDQTPQLEIASRHDVGDAGHGEDYFWGDAIRTPSEAKHLAETRAQAHAAQSMRFHGHSTVPSMRSGFFFSLKNHYRSDFNQDYLVLECHHKGNQVSSLNPDIQEGLRGLVEQTEIYTNTFTALPADIQFRLPQTLQKPRIRGLLPAHVDAAGEGQYAELDEQGRYKVILPFDLSGRKDGQASSWVRMMQPYAGADHGMHFPLHKGTEVLLAFLDGDPDRPVIAGAVPNPLHPSPVTHTNQTTCDITTGGQNALRFQDQQGQESVLVSSPHKSSYIRVGAPRQGENQEPPPPNFPTNNDNDDDKSHWHTKHDSGGFKIYTEGDVCGNVHNHMTVNVGGNATSITLGGEEHLTGGFFNRTVIGETANLHVGRRDLVNLSNDTTLNMGIKLHIAAGLNINMDMAKHIKVRPTCMKTAEEKVDVLQFESKIAEMQQNISTNAKNIRRSTQSIQQVSRKLSANETRIAKSESQISLNSVVMAEKITRVLKREITVLQNAIRTVDEETNIGDSHRNLFSDSVEITDKTFV